jgi:hypothetical protein
MKNYILALLIATASVQADVPDNLINALCVVESNNNPSAVGDNGNAYGVLQIWEAIICDVNAVYGTRYTHRDAFDAETAKAICRMYLNHYATEKRLGRVPTLADYARIWNGGPNGYKKYSTLRYWSKVRKAL